MKTNPRSEEEIQKENLLPVDEYSFEVVEAKDKRSKAGNDMIELKLQIFANDDDSSRFVFDYLMEKLAFKLRHFCVATGLIEIYESGNLTASDCTGKTGTCKISIKEDKTGAFPARNEVKDYLFEVVSRPSESREPAKKVVASTVAASKDMEDDDIPF